MSSRLLPFGDAQRASSIRWREMGAPQSAADMGDDGPPLDPASMPASRPQIERQCQQEVESARAEGYRNGEAAGRERAAAELRPVAEQLARSVEELATLRPHLRQQAETDMLRLAMAIARRVLRRELAVDPEALHGLAMAALEKLGSQEIIRVRVHASMVQEMRSRLATLPGRMQVEVTADPGREPGAIVFETERGNLDASIETQLDEIERGLADRLRRKV